MGIEKFFGEKVAGFGSSVYDVSRGIGKNLVYGVAGLAAVCGVAVANPGDARGGSVLEEIFKGALVDQTAREIVKSGSDNGGANVVVNGGTCELTKADMAVLNTIRSLPRVIDLGVDRDNDGETDWAYYDGKGKSYPVSKYYCNGNSVIGKEYKPDLDLCFTYINEKGNGSKVPSNTLVIPYMDKTFALD